MPKYHLHYFNGRGRAEVSRLLFTAAGVDFEDVRCEMEAWPTKKQDMPIKQMPVLFIDGVDTPLTQCFAIARYLAREFGMGGSNTLETARVEEVIELTIDIWIPMMGAKFEPDETLKAEKIKAFNEGKCPTILGFLETVLERNNGGNGFFIGDKLTVADLQVFITLEEGLCKAHVERFPKLQALFKRICEIPTIKAYLGKRLVTYI